MKALEDLVEFQENNDDKILLWTTIRELLVKADSNDEVNAWDLFGALGIDLKRPEDPVEKLKEVLRLEASVYRLGGEQSVEAVIADRNEFYSEDQRFVLFGREYVFRQAEVSVRAYKLIQFLKMGDPDTHVSSLEDLADLQLANLSNDNVFYEQFKKSPYVDQIRIVQRLTEDLDKCSVGREFLADLFEYRHRAIFDPFGFVPPLPILGTDTGYVEPFTQVTPAEPVDKSTVSVSVKHSDELKPYFTEDFRIDLSESNIAGVQFGTYLSDLLGQLLPGLGYFYATRVKDKKYMELAKMGQEPYPLTVFGRFMIGVVSAFASDDHIRTVIRETDWTGLTRPDWSEDVLSEFRTSGTFAEDDVTKLVVTMVNGGEAFFNTYRLPGSNFATSFKGMLSALVTFHLFADFGSVARMDDVEKLDAVLSMATAVTDAANVVALHARRLGEYLKIAGVALNGVTAIFNFLRMAEEFAEGDDAGIGYGMMGVGFAVFTGVGFYAETVTVATGFTILASVFWLAIGVALVVIGTILVILLQDGPFEEWLKNTFFGKRWSKLERNDENFRNPFTKPHTYGYKKVIPSTNSVRVGGVDFLRQMSGLFSTVRPINITRMDFGRETRDGENRWRGHFTIQPQHKQLLADGYLFLRPVRVSEKRPPGPGPRGIRPSDPITDTCVHRFSLDDGPNDENVRSKTDLGVAIPDLMAAFEGYELNWALDAIEKHREVDFGSGGLDLEIVAVDSEKNDDGETAITKWEAKVWDMSGTDADRIFGVPRSKLEAIFTTYFVELIYVPPELAEAIESGGAVWFRPEELPTVSREIHGVRREDGGLF
ncbi:hypothetical protein [Haladaptatus halobius]|uniref:hypothetical protein n=1 Tax=Haladaptatus halobius TaxID=2884875 RepID=UPI001D0A6547|nr:hypothetical protein [Haladaptatus halobius]